MVMTVRQSVALMTILDGCSGESREGSRTGIWSTPATAIVSYQSQSACSLLKGSAEYGHLLLTTYGPMSDGVTGSAGGGGRLIKVGVVILGSGIAISQPLHYGEVFPAPGDFGDQVDMVMWDKQLNVPEGCCRSQDSVPAVKWGS